MGGGGGRYVGREGGQQSCSMAPFRDESLGSTNHSPRVSVCLSLPVCTLHNRPPPLLPSTFVLTHIGSLTITCGMRSRGRPGYGHRTRGISDIYVCGGWGGDRRGGGQRGEPAL